MIRFGFSRRCSNNLLWSSWTLSIEKSSRIVRISIAWISCVIVIRSINQFINPSLHRWKFVEWILVFVAASGKHIFRLFPYFLSQTENVECLAVTFVCERHRKTKDLLLSLTCTVRMTFLMIIIALKLFGFGNSKPNRVIIIFSSWYAETL